MKPKKFLIMLASLTFLLIAIALFVAFNGQNLPAYSTILLVSDKLSPDTEASARIITVNPLTNEPLANSEISLILHNEDEEIATLYSGVTNEQGTADIKFTIPNVAAGEYVLEANSKYAKGKDKIYKNVSIKREYKIFISSDKPIYQPNQIIHIRTLTLESNTLKPVDEKGIIIEIEDAKGNKVYKKELLNSEYGIASTDFKLADEIILGRYTLRATIDGITSERKIRVENYVLPKFKIGIETKRDFYSPNEILEGYIKTNYFFGKTLSNAKVNIKLKTFIIEEEIISEIIGITDTKGYFHFSYELPNYFIAYPIYKGNANVQIEVSVTDKAEHTESAYHNITISQNPMEIVVIPESGELIAGVDNIIYIITSYPDGSPAECTLQAFRQIIDTDELGIATIHYTPPEIEIAYETTITATDGKGITTEQIIPLNYCRDYYSGDTILLRPNKALYTSGETAKFTILSTKDKGTAYLDIIKNQQTILTKSIEIKDGEAQLELDLTPDLFGTLEINCYTLNFTGTYYQGNLIRDTRLIYVEVANELNIALSTDKKVYKPGEEALLEFTITDNENNPTQAALGINIIDESVFALSEMHPGLERVYFTLQKELLQPRYQIKYSPEEIIYYETPAKERKDLLAQIIFSAYELSRYSFDITETYSTKLWKIAHNKKMILSWLSMLPIFGLVLFAIYAIIVCIMQLHNPISLDMEKIEELTGFKLYHLSFTIFFILPALSIATIFIIGSERLIVFLWIGLEIIFLIAHLLSIGQLLKEPAIKLHSRLSMLMLLTFLMMLMTLLMVAELFAMEFLNIYPSEELGIVFLISLGLGIVLAWIISFLIPKTFHSALESNIIKSKKILIISYIVSVIVIFLILLLIIYNPLIMYKTDRSAGDIDYLGEIQTTTDSWSDKVEKGISPPAAQSREVRVRKYFPETMYSNPELITDDKGKAELRIRTADSITDWRLSITASSINGQLGYSQDALRVFQDFFIDIDLPYSYTQYDEVNIPIAVYNYLPKPQQVSIEVKRDIGFRIIGVNKKTLIIGANDIQVVYFPIKLTGLGLYTIQVKADGSYMSDAMERTLYIKPYGKEFTITQNDYIKEGTITQSIIIPEEAINDASNIIIRFYPSITSQVFEGLDGMLKMPYGCFEQTSSITYPNALILQYLKLTQTSTPEIEMKAENLINIGYQRLLSFEVKSGGFSLYGDAPANPILTAYGLLEFVDMKKVYPIDINLIERTKNWLLEMQNPEGYWEPPEASYYLQKVNGRLVTSAYITWSLLESGYEGEQIDLAIDYIKANLHSIKDNYALGLVANALVAYNPNDKFTQNLLSELDSKKIIGEGGNYWTTESQTAYYGRGLSADIETSSLIAYAFLKGNSFLGSVNNTIKFLMQNRTADGTFGSTQATILALKLILKAAGHTPQDPKANIRIDMNDKHLTTVFITKSNNDIMQQVSCKELVQTGENKITFKCDKDVNLSYQIIGKYYISWENLKSAEEMDETEERLELKVTYDKTNLRLNDIITTQVKLHYNGIEPVFMLILDLGIPPGFRVLPESLEALKERGIIDKYNITSNQLTLYLSKLEPQEELIFDYQLQAKMVIKAKTPKSKVYEYYNPDNIGEAEPVDMIVR